MLDLCFSWCTHYANPLRAVPGLLRARSGRRFFAVLKKMIPETSQSLIPIIFFILLMMVFSIIFYGTYYDGLQDPYYTFYNWVWLVFTNDTFARILPDPLQENFSYVAYFFPAIYIGQKFLLNLIIGETYDTFRSYVKKQLKKEKLKEMQGLTKAFSALDDRKEGIISSVVWRECLLALHPDISLEAIALYYELISGGNSQGVSVLQFLSLKKVMSFKLSKKSTFNTASSQNIAGKRLSFMQYGNLQVAKAYMKASEYYSDFRLPLTSKLYYPTYRLLKKLDKFAVWRIAIYVDLILFALGYSNTVLVAFPPQIHLTPCTLMNLLYICEFMLRLCAHEGSLADMHAKANFESVVFMTGVVARLAYSLVTLFYGYQDYTVVNFALASWPWAIELSFPLWKVLNIVRMMRCVRLINHNKTLGHFYTGLFDVAPVLMETMVFAFIIVYVFGLSGNLLFGDYMEDWSTPLLGFVKAQQLFFMCDFFDTVEDTMSKVHPIAVLFFITYLILSLAVTNIVLSITIDLHSNVLAVKSIKDKDGMKNKMELVFEKMVAQARFRAVFCKGQSNLNFNNIQMSRFQSSDVRNFIAGSRGNELQLENIKNCKKYSTVDIVKHYNDYQRNHKDLNWEVDFLNQVYESGVNNEREFNHKEVLFEEGKPARVLYLLVGGFVTITRTIVDEETGATMTQQARMNATNFLGTESLQPMGVYSMTCEADKAATCLVFSQDDLAHKLSEELCGSIVRMAFKSTAVLDKEFEDMMKRGSFRL